MRGLLVGNDAAIADWTYKTFNLIPYPINRAFGIVEDGKLVGGVLFQNFNGYNVEMCYYGPQTLSLGIVRSLARVAVSFNVSRGTVITSKRNRRLMKSLVRIGFKLEGSQRRFFGEKDIPRNTGVRFVMFREDIDRLAALPGNQGVVNG